MIWGKGPNSLFCIYLLVQAPFVKETILSSLNGPGTLFKNQLIKNVSLFLETQFYYIIHTSIFMPIPQCLGYCSFILSFKIRKSESFNFVLFPGCFEYSGSFSFPYDQIPEKILTEKLARILMGTVLNL